MKKLLQILQKQRSSLDSWLMAEKVTDLQESLDSRKVEFTLKISFKNSNHKTHDIMKKFIGNLQLPLVIFLISNTGHVGKPLTCALGK